MKSLPLIIAALSLFLTGCESLQTAAGSVKERWEARDVGKARILPAEPKVVFEAARASILSMGFKITRSGAAQGHIDAVNGLQSDDTLRGSHQIIMKVRITRVGEGSELRAFLTEIIEDNSTMKGGQATETPLIDTPLYEVFFRQVTQSVGAK